jgi:hypothetical protein
VNGVNARKENVEEKCCVSKKTIGDLWHNMKRNSILVLPFSYTHEAKKFIIMK